MTRSQRKDEHVRLAYQQNTEVNHAFDELDILYNSVADVQSDAIDLNVSFLGKTTTAIYINAMTGGSEMTSDINRDLAIVARECGLMMAVGSQSAALDDSDLAGSFKVVRDVNPQGIVLANVGAENSLKRAHEAVRMLDADALQVHVNRPQELVMSEGERDFSHWSSSLKSLVESIEVPVIVKEVGFGMSYQTLSHLLALGVHAVDISGKGGTNFIAIEKQRGSSRLPEGLDNFGLTAVESLLQSSSLQSQMTVLASGGIKTAMDCVKCFVLGARAVGLSSWFLVRLMNEGVERTIEMTQELLRDIRFILALYGVESVSQASRLDYVISERLKQYYR